MKMLKHISSKNLKRLAYFNTMQTKFYTKKININSITNTNPNEKSEFSKQKLEENKLIELENLKLLKASESSNYIINLYNQNQNLTIKQINQLSVNIRAYIELFSTQDSLLEVNSIDLNPTLTVEEEGDEKEIVNAYKFYEFNRVKSDFQIIREKLKPLINLDHIINYFSVINIGKEIFDLNEFSIIPDSLFSIISQNKSLIKNDLLNELLYKKFNVNISNDVYESIFSNKIDILVWMMNKNRIGYTDTDEMLFLEYALLSIKNFKNITHENLINLFNENKNVISFFENLIFELMYDANNVYIYNNSYSSVSDIKELDNSIKLEKYSEGILKEQLVRLNTRLNDFEGLFFSRKMENNNNGKVRNKYIFKHLLNMDISQNDKEYFNSIVNNEEEANNIAFELLYYLKTLILPAYTEFKSSDKKYCFNNKEDSINKNIFYIKRNYLFEKKETIFMKININSNNIMTNAVNIKDNNSLDTKYNIETNTINNEQTIISNIINCFKINDISDIKNTLYFKILFNSTSIYLKEKIYSESKIQTFYNKFNLNSLNNTIFQIKFYNEYSSIVNKVYLHYYKLDTKNEIELDYELKEIFKDLQQETNISLSSVLIINPTIILLKNIFHHLNLVINHYELILKDHEIGIKEKNTKMRYDNNTTGELQKYNESSISTIFKKQDNNELFQLNKNIDDYSYYLSEIDNDDLQYLYFIVKLMSLSKLYKNKNTDDQNNNSQENKNHNDIDNQNNLSQEFERNITILLKIMNLKNNFVQNSKLESTVKLITFIQIIMRISSFYNYDRENQLNVNDTIKTTFKNSEIIFLINLINQNTLEQILNNSLNKDEFEYLALITIKLTFIVGCEIDLTNSVSVNSLLKKVQEFIYFNNFKRKETFSTEFINQIYECYSVLGEETNLVDIGFLNYLKVNIKLSNKMMELI